MNEPLGYSRDGDVVTLRMDLDDWENLVWVLGCALGFAGGNARALEDAATARAIRALMKRLTTGHPDLHPLFASEQEATQD